MSNDRSSTDDWEGSDDSEDSDDSEGNDDEFVDLQDNIWPEVSDGASSGTFSATTRELEDYSKKNSSSERGRNREIGESIETDEDDKDVDASTDRKCFGVSVPAFAKEEHPFLGYTVASVIFFLSAVGKRMKSDECLFGEMTSSAVGGDIFTDIYSDGGAYEDGLYEDMVSEYTDVYTDVYSDTICGCYGAFVGKLRPGPYAYALCFGIFGALMGGGVVGWMRYNASLKAKRSSGPPASDDFSEEPDDDPYKSSSELFLENHLWLINIVLFLWAFIGWLFFTFWGDQVYAHTGNGFFALWAMMLFSIWNFGITIEDLAEHARKTDSCIYGMSLSSIIATIALGSDWKYGTYRGVAGFALSVCVFAILFGLATVYFSKFARGGTQLDPKIKFWCIAAVLVLWILAACLTTFIGPFLTTGNGYFSVWASVVFTGLAFAEAQKESQDL